MVRVAEVTTEFPPGGGGGSVDVAGPPFHEVSPSAVLFFHQGPRASIIDNGILVLFEKKRRGTLQLCVLAVALVAAAISAVGL